MSKSSKKSSNDRTAILCLDTDLSIAVDAILALARKKELSKPALLNILAAQICGNKHDWGFIRGSASPMVSKRAKDQLDDIIEALANRTSDTAVDDTDPFTQQCIDHAYSAFLSVAEGDCEIQEAENEGLFDSKTIDEASMEAAKAFVEEQFGNPVDDHSRGQIQQFGFAQSISNIVIDSDWVRLSNILDIEQRRELRDNCDAASENQE